MITEAPSKVIEEIRPLTGLRAYATVWVMLIHLGDSEYARGVVDLGQFVAHAYWAVVIFFILSGFMLTHVYGDGFAWQPSLHRYRNFLAARFGRIYPVHLFALLLLVIYAVVRGTVRHEAIFKPGAELDTLFLNIVMLHGWFIVDHLSWNFPSWSISSEWFAYLLMFPLLTRVFRNTSGLVVFIAAFLFITVPAYFFFQGMEAHMATTHTLPVNSWGLPRVFFEFTFGYALCRLWKTWQPSPWMSDIMVFVGIGGLVLLSYSPLGWGWLIIPTVTALLLGLASPGKLSDWVFGNRVAVYWGERSYPIYMLHAVVLTYSNHLLKPFEHSLTPAVVWVVVIGQAVAVLLISLLVFELIEAPGRRWIRKLLSSRSKAQVSAPVPPAPQTTEAS